MFEPPKNCELFKFCGCKLWAAVSDKGIAYTMCTEHFLHYSSYPSQCCPGMLLNCKQCHKNVNEWCLHFNVCQLSLLTFKVVLMTLMLALMKVYFFLLYVE